MIPLKQRYRHYPENGIWGDCQRASMASILELSLDDVPHFGDNGPDEKEFWRLVTEWVKTRGLILLDIPFTNDLDSILTMMAAKLPDNHYLLSGLSRTGVNHVVVARGGSVVHDPSLDDSGIVGPCSDGYYWVGMFLCPL